MIETISRVARMTVDSIQLIAERINTGDWGDWEERQDLLAELGEECDYHNFLSKQLKPWNRV